MLKFFLRQPKEKVIPLVFTSKMHFFGLFSDLFSTLKFSLNSDLPILKSFNKNFWRIEWRNKRGRSKLNKRESEFLSERESHQHFYQKLSFRSDKSKSLHHVNNVSNSVVCFIFFKLPMHSVNSWKNVPWHLAKYKSALSDWLSSRQVRVWISASANSFELFVRILQQIPQHRV